VIEISVETFLEQSSIHFQKSIQYIWFKNIMGFKLEIKQKVSRISPFDGIDTYELQLNFFSVP
jgi:hypothetical protein